MHDTSCVAIVRTKVELPQGRVIKLLIAQADVLLQPVILDSHGTREIPKHILVLQIQLRRGVVLQDPRELQEDTLTAGQSPVM